ncbi:MAG: NrdH-redoxin [Desulfuromonas sp.]|nr:MAG: NrdH-redoxin [Desulfuromonas sp.]
MRKHVTILLLLTLACLIGATPGLSEPDAAHQWPTIELYTTAWCPYCLKAKAFFDERNIPYIVYDIEKSPEAAAKKEQLAPGTGVPVVVIDDIVICGYSKKAFISALELDE